MWFAQPTAPEALKMVGAERPDLVLMDVMMPGMDGLEVCRRLRQEGSTANLPIVLSRLASTTNRSWTFRRRLTFV